MFDKVLQMPAHLTIELEAHPVDLNLGLLLLFCAGYQLLHLLELTGPVWRVRAGRADHLHVSPAPILMHEMVVPLSQFRS